MLTPSWKCRFVFVLGSVFHETIESLESLLEIAAQADLE